MLSYKHRVENWTEKSILWN